MADPVAIDASYRRQVDLLLRALPHVTAESCFALKGGTAINLFVRGTPHHLRGCRSISTGRAAGRIAPGIRRRPRPHRHRGGAGIAVRACHAAGRGEARGERGRHVVKVEVKTVLRRSAAARPGAGPLRGGPGRLRPPVRRHGP